MECWKIFLGFVCLIVALAYQKYQKLSKNLPIPSFDLKEFWGKGDVANYKEDTSVKPFKVSFGNDVSRLNSLSQKSLSQKLLKYF